MDVLVTVDKKGRVLIPNEFRKELDAEKFIVKKKADELVFTPVVSPDKLFGIWAKKKLPEFKRERGTEHAFD